MPKRGATAASTLRPSATTSGPMPSPPITAMRCVRDGAGLMGVTGGERRGRGGGTGGRIRHPDLEEELRPGGQTRGPARPGQIEAASWLERHSENEHGKRHERAALEGQ